MTLRLLRLGLWGFRRHYTDMYVSDTAIVSAQIRTHDPSRCRLMVPPIRVTERRVTQHLGGPCVRALPMRHGQGTEGTPLDPKKDAAQMNNMWMDNDSGSDCRRKIPPVDVEWMLKNRLVRD